MDLAYEGLGDIVPPYSRAASKIPSTCFVLCALNRFCNQVIYLFIYFGAETKVPVIVDDVLEIQANFEKSLSSALEAPRCFHSGARMKGIIPLKIEWLQS